ncbi:hypothetical protein M0805_009036 [Coniferiporia weirii]|nr:hypothetical protein M0805_009036 [Coniferiporia weirii]
MIRPAIRAVLIDLSGTLHIGSTPTPSAINALKRVREESGITIRFCSNTSKESTNDLRTRLNNIGFDVKDGELWTSLGALKDVVRTKNLRRPYFLLSKSAREEFPTIEDDAQELHHSHYDSVVVGLAPDQFNYDNLTKAFRVLSQEIPCKSEDSGNQNASSLQTRPPLITTHRARYIRTPDGELSLGPGPFVAALEEAVGNGLCAEVVGKPNRTFFERVLASIGDEMCQPNQALQGRDRNWEGVAIIGDDVEADLGGGAAELGLWRVLVRTGKYRPGDESRPGLLPPDEMQDSFATFVAELFKDKDSRSG